MIGASSTAGSKVEQPFFIPEQHANPKRHFFVNFLYVSVRSFAELPGGVMQDAKPLAPASDGPPRYPERSSDFLLEIAAIFQIPKKLRISTAVNPARNAEGLTPAINGARRNREL